MTRITKIVATVTMAAAAIGGTVLGSAPTAGASSPSTVTLSQSSSTGVMGQDHLMTATVTNAPDGTPVQFEPGGGLLAGTTYAGIASSAYGGYWLAGTDGTVLAEGGAPDLGGATPGSSDVSAIAATPDGGGYFLVTLDGAVTARGDAHWKGDVSNLDLPAPIVGIAAMSGGSYVLLDSSGDVYAFSSGFYGSLSVGGDDVATAIASSGDGLGYTICAESGRCQAFGDSAIGGTVPGADADNPLVSFALASAGPRLYGLLADGSVSVLGDVTYVVPDPGGIGNAPMIAISTTPNGTYHTVGLDGEVSGTAPFKGDAFTRMLHDSTASIEVTSLSGGTTRMQASSNGAYTSLNGILTTSWSVPPSYWLVASDGGIFAFGDAGFYGSTGGMRLNQPIVGMAATPDGGGYWLVASDGGIFAFGDAAYHGSTGNIRLNRPIVGMAATPDGDGYWLAASDGGVFTFGDAKFRGAGMTNSYPYVGISSLPGVQGYLLAQSNGVVWDLGNTAIFPIPNASQPVLAHPAVGVSATPDGFGYWVVASDGGVFAYDSALFGGSAGGIKLNKPIVGMAAYPFPILDFPGAARPIEIPTSLDRGSVRRSLGATRR